MPTFTDAELIAFLDESLPAERSVELERSLKNDSALRQRLQYKIGQQAAGLHTIGSIWQRANATCPSRTELAQFISEDLEHDAAEYVRFHLIQMGCRFCQANCADLLSRSTPCSQNQARHSRFFQTSVGHLHSRSDKEESSDLDGAV